MLEGGLTMNTSSLSHKERRLMELLKSLLSGSAPAAELFKNMTEQEWRSLYRLAAHHGVMALAWDAVLQLPEEFQPPRSTRLMWGLAVQRYEERYARYVRTIAHLSEYYASHGIHFVVLKGVGLSTYYPVPAHREGGDIDIYTYSADTAVMSDAEANRLADQLMLEQGIEVDKHTSDKHSVFLFEGISVENHHMFINADRYKLAQRMDPLLHQLLQPREVELSCGPAAPDEHYLLRIPSTVFNQVFIPFHAAQHYGSGLTLHQLMDCASVFREHGFILPPEVHAEPLFIRAVNAFTYLCSEYFGLKVPLEASPETVELAHRIMREVLRPTFPRKVPTQNPFGILYFKFKRFMYKGELADGLLGATMGNRIKRSILIHIRRPEWIFGD
jgi:hypothetical protein